MLKEVRRNYQLLDGLRYPGQAGIEFFAFADGRIFYNGKSLAKNDKNFEKMMTVVARAAMIIATNDSTAFFSGNWAYKPHFESDDKIIDQNGECFNVNPLNWVQLIRKHYFLGDDNIVILYDPTEDLIEIGHEKEVKESNIYLKEEFAE